MKRTVIFIVLFFCLAGLVQAGCYSIETELIYKPIGGTHGGTPKAPARPWYTTMVTLPATLSGDYEIRFMADTYCYYGYIYL